jgi:four helix bundle protein
MTNRLTATLAITSHVDFGEGMNHSEVTMNNALPNGNLIVTEKAIDAADEAISLVRRVPAPSKSLADQVIRSAASVPANLSEGHGRTGRDRTHHWRIAFASAKEVDTHIRLLARTNSVDRRRAAEILDLFDEIRAMTWRFLHPKPRRP